MSETAKLQILIVAPNASSEFGGEAFLPLKYFQILRRRGYPVGLVAHSRNRRNLEVVLGPLIEDVHFVEDSAWHRAIWAVGRKTPAIIRETLVAMLLNLVNERFQARIIRREIRAGKVAVIHQPIPVSPRAPSGIYGFGVPVVIGPMNGGMTFPPGYEEMQGKGTRRFMFWGRMMAGLVNRIIPGKRRAAVLLVANDRTRRALSVGDHPAIMPLVENAVDLSVWQRPVRMPPRPGAPVDEPAGSLRLVYMGRLVDWKAVDITLEALRLARAEGVDATLDILGDGPERARLEAGVVRLGLDGCVTFHGFRPQSDCAALIADRDALILNSLSECGGAVVLEAMGLGLPVIASDWGGPGDYLDESCGILVSPVPRAEFAPQLAQAIRRLAANPALRARMGAAGRARVEADFNWDRKVDRMLDIYAEAVARPV